MSTRRSFLQQAGILSAATTLTPSCSHQTRGKNVILIMADDLGLECLGCYGGTSYKTPNLDALAQSGVRFNHAYAQPLCTPTRVQIMTGQYNYRNWQAFGILPPGETTFGHIMQNAGYATCIVGKWQLYSYNPPNYEPEWRGKGMLPENAGFDEYILHHAGHTEIRGSRYQNPKVLENGTYHEGPEDAYGPDLYCDYLCDFAERHQEEPFFIYYPMALTHAPFEPTPHSDDWDTNRGTRNNKYFGDMVEYMDHIVGRIMQKLDDLQLRDDTLLIFYGDNGTPWQMTSMMGDVEVPGGKGKTTDAGTHVPLIASMPGTIEAGRVLDDLIDSTDFLPTITDFCGMEIPGHLPVDGRSFLPQLQGERGNPRDWVYFPYNPRPGINKETNPPDRWAQDHRWKLYEDGRFFDIPADIYEQRAIPVGQGGPDADSARKKLQHVLDTLI
jgi:arylsulfatase A